MNTIKSTNITHNNVFSFLWKIIKPYKYYYLMQLIAPMYTGFMDLIYFYCVKLFIDIIIKEAFTYQELIYPLSIFFTTPIIMNILWRIANVFEWKATPKVRKEILSQSYDYVQYHSYYFFQNNLSGSIISKIKGILDAYDKLFGPMLVEICVFGIMLISGVVAVLFVNITLGFFVFMWLIVFFFVMYKMAKKLNYLVYVETQSRHNIIGIIADKITNIISLFYFSSRKQEYNTLRQQITADFIPKQIRSYKYNFLFQLVMWTLYFIMWMFFIFMLIHTRKKEFITAGTIAFAFGVIAKVSDATWMLLNKLQEFIRLAGDFKSSFEILTIPHSSTDQKDAKELTINHPSIEFKNVYFNYQDNIPIFKGFNLKINSGENIGIVGRSGAGKTSLVNILLRFFEIQEGKIFIDKQDIAHVTLDSLRTNISVIPQDIMLFHRSLLENIRYGCPDATDAEVINAAKKAHAHEFITTLQEGYNTLVGERGIKLSGGQRQRIAIARAILKNAVILILDEATSALDSKTEKYIQDGINHIITKEDQTVIAIAHRLSTLRHMDQIIVIDEGIIVERGSHNELMMEKHSLYKKLWHEQMI